MYPSKRQMGGGLGSNFRPVRLRSLECAEDVRDGDLVTLHAGVGTRRGAARDVWLAASILTYDRLIATAGRELQDLREEYEVEQRAAAREAHVEVNPMAGFRRQVRLDQQARRLERLCDLERTYESLTEGFLCVMREALASREG